MAIECGIIAAMFTIMAVGFFIKKRKRWAFATLPLTLVPLVEFVLDFICSSVFSFQISPFVRIVGLLIAIAVSCIWIGFISFDMKHKSKRFTYIGITYVFNVLLAAILINNILKELII